MKNFMNDKLKYDVTGRILVGCDKSIDGKVIIPSGITAIGAAAFASCEGIQSISIPEGVEEIKESAFINCRSLNHIKIPTSLKRIGMDAFIACGENMVVEYCGTVEEWCGITFVNIRSNPCYPAGNLFTKGILTSKITIPGTAVNDIKFAFAGCQNITHVTIENGIEKIGTSAFDWCCNLVEVVLPSASLTTIGTRAFKRCHSLKQIDLPSSVKAIEVEAFVHCNELSSVNLNGGLEVIDTGAFANCPSLKHLYIPKSVQFLRSQIAYVDPLKKEESDVADFAFYCESEMPAADWAWSRDWNHRIIGSRAKKTYATVNYNVPRWWYNKYVYEK